MAENNIITDMIADINVTEKRFEKHCMAPGCTNYYYKNRDCHYHQLPLADTDRLKQWLHNMKRKAAPVNENSRVCSDHFAVDDYEVEGFFDNNGVFSYRKTSTLKPTAVPTIFNFSDYNSRATAAPSNSASRASKARQERHTNRDTKKKQAEVFNNVACIYFALYVLRFRLHFS